MHQANFNNGLRKAFINKNKNDNKINELIINNDHSFYNIDIFLNLYNNFICFIYSIYFCIRQYFLKFILFILLFIKDILTHNNTNKGKDI